MYWYVLVCTGMYLTIRAEKVLILLVRTEIVHHLHNMCNACMMKPKPFFLCAMYQCTHQSEECTVNTSTYQYILVHTSTYQYVLVHATNLFCGRHDMVQGSTSSAVPYDEMSWYSTDRHILACNEKRQVYRILREMTLYWPVLLYVLVHTAF